MPDIFNNNSTATTTAVPPKDQEQIDQAIIENIPVHTMKKDQENIKIGQFDGDENTGSINTFPGSTSPQKIMSKDVLSPFLSEEPSKQKISNATPETEKPTEIKPPITSPFIKPAEIKPATDNPAPSPMKQEAKPVTKPVQPPIALRPIQPTATPKPVIPAPNPTMEQKARPMPKPVQPPIAPKPVMPAPNEAPAVKTIEVKTSEPAIQKPENSPQVKPTSYRLEELPETPKPGAYSSQLRPAVPDPVKNQPFPNFSQANSFQSALNPVDDKVPTEPTNPADNLVVGSDSHRFWSKAITWAIVIVVLAIIGEGGYYIWVTKFKNNKDSAIIAPPPENPGNQDNQTPDDTSPPVDIAPPKQAYFEDKPNYLVIDETSANKAQLKTLLEETAKKMAESKYNAPLEFVLVDKNNHPLEINKFLTVSGIIFPKEILSNLKPGPGTYSLFLFNDNGLIRAGASIDVVAEDKMKAALTKVENNLVSMLEPFLLAKNAIAKKQFSSSTYNGADIRYQNIDASEPLSVDYTVNKGKFIIGTSKMTIRAIIDHTSKL